MNILDFGAIGDGTTDDADAINKAINACNKQGGGRVNIPSGKTYLASPIFLKANVELHVENNARILAHPDESKYTISAFRNNKSEGMVWIYAKDANRISITGSGILDGNSVAFMGPEEKAAYALKPITEIDPRPHLLTLEHCENVTIRDVTLANSSYWCLHLIGCNEVLIQGTRILNSLKVRNSDGIDIDHSRNVRISDCYIESGDDCICFKCRREFSEYGPTENVTVSNVICVSTSCSIKLGSENVDAIRNVLVTNCIIRNSNRGIGIQNRDEGIVENVLFSNCIVQSRLFDEVWWGKAEPIYVTSYRRASVGHKDANVRFAEGQTEGKAGPVRNVHFKDIICESENTIFIGGEPGLVSNTTLNGIKMHLKKPQTDKYKANMVDLRPREGIGMIEAPTTGIFIDTAENISIRDFALKMDVKVQNNQNFDLIFAENCVNCEREKVRLFY